MVAVEVQVAAEVATGLAALPLQLRGLETQVESLLETDLPELQTAEAEAVREARV
jgi:hypothetical protein